jgi:hypothetical protein
MATRACNLFQTFGELSFHSPFDIHSFNAGAGICAPPLRTCIHRTSMTLAIDTRPTAKTRTTLTLQIEALLSRLHPVVERERRQDDRIAIPVLFRLTPYDDNHRPIDEEASIVVGKNISRRGLSFYHEHPITHRRALIEVADPCAGTFAAEVDITWCRFTKPGWYESGGRLIRAGRPGSESSATDRSQENAAKPDVLSGLPATAAVAGA